MFWKALGVVTFVLALALISIDIMPNGQQLQYPLDPTSQAIVERSVKDMLPGLIIDALWDKVYYYNFGFDFIDSVGTAGTVTAVAGAATLDTKVGTVTSEALTTAAGANYTLTLTNARIGTASVVLVSVDNGTNTTVGIAVNRVTPGSGSVVILIRNTHAADALNGTIKINFQVDNQNGGWDLVKTGTNVGDAAFNNNQVTLRTGSTSGNQVQLYKSPAESNQILFGKRTRFRTQIDLSSVADVTAYVLTGGAFRVGGFGFKVVNSGLYGVVIDGSSVETLTPQLATLVADTPLDVEARWDPERSVTFYIGTFTNRPSMDAVGKLTSGFSTGTITGGTWGSTYSSWGSLALYDLTTNAAAAKLLRFSHFEFLQEK